jgi:hypothetical protein
MTAIKCGDKFRCVRISDDVAVGVVEFFEKPITTIDGCFLHRLKVVSGLDERSFLIWDNDATPSTPNGHIFIGLSGEYKLLLL